MSIPSPDDVIAFVVFFFPGFITLLLLSRLCGANVKQRSDLEKIVLSSIFSILSFLLVGVSPQAENIASAIFDVEIVLLVLLVSVFLAIVLWMIIKVWNFSSDILSVKSQRIWSKFGRTYTSFEPCSIYVLRQLYNAREKNELVINSSSGEIYRGNFGGYTPDPLEIILIGTEENPIRQLKNGHWENIDVYLIYFGEKDIKRISATAVSGESH